MCHFNALLIIIILFYPVQRSFFSGGGLHEPHTILSRRQLDLLSIAGVYLACIIVPNRSFFIKKSTARGAFMNGLSHQSLTRNFTLIGSESRRLIKTSLVFNTSRLLILRSWQDSCLLKPLN